MIYFVVDVSRVHALSGPSSLPLIAHHHYWMADGSTQAFGVVYPRAGAHPLDVVDALTALGCTVLASTHESTPVGATVAAAVGQGVVATDDTFACATKMHAASGIKHFRPHRY